MPDDVLSMEGLGVAPEVETNRSFRERASVQAVHCDSCGKCLLKRCGIFNLTFLMNDHWATSTMVEYFDLEEDVLKVEEQSGRSPHDVSLWTAHEVAIAFRADGPGDAWFGFKELNTIKAFLHGLWRLMPDKPFV